MQQRTERLVRPSSLSLGENIGDSGRLSPDASTGCHCTIRPPLAMASTIDLYKPSSTMMTAVVIPGHHHPAGPLRVVGGCRVEDGFVVALPHACSELA